METRAKSEHVVFSFNSITAEAESGDFTIGELQFTETPLLKGAVVFLKMMPKVFLWPLYTHLCTEIDKRLWIRDNF